MKKYSILLPLIFMFVTYCGVSDITEPPGQTDDDKIVWTPPEFNEAGFAIIDNFPDSLLGGTNDGNLRIIAAADERVAWVSDWTLKVILKTEDGGSSWKLLEPPVSGEIYTIESFDSLNVWIGTQAGEIFFSDDGGYNWSIQHNGNFINYIEFFTKNIGVAMGDPLEISTNPIEILHTSDGGKTWVNKNTQIDYGTTHYAVSFSSPDVGWIRTFPGNNYVFKTNDGGASWDTVYPGGRENIWTLVNLSEQVTVLAYNLTPMRTTDAGNSWEQLPVVYPTRFAKVRGEQNYVFGIVNGIVASADLGENWKEVDPQIKNVKYWQGISSPKKNVVWISGKSNKITYTVKMDSILAN